MMTLIPNHEVGGDSMSIIEMGMDVKGSGDGCTLTILVSTSK